MVKKKSITSSYILELRNLLGMTQEEFAATVGVTPRTVSVWETTSPPQKKKVLWRMADIAPEGKLKNFFNEGRVLPPVSVVGHFAFRETVSVGKPYPTPVNGHHGSELTDDDKADLEMVKTVFLSRSTTTSALKSNIHEFYDKVEQTKKARDSMIEQDELKRKVKDLEARLEELAKKERKDFSETDTRTLTGTTPRKKL